MPLQPPDTARLRLRALRADDLGDMARMDGDPRVMRYVGDGSTLSRDVVARGLVRPQRYYELYPGLGAWRAERAAGRFVGWFCLKYMPNTVEIEVGYRLVPDAWGKGYATEGAKVVLTYGFETLGLWRKSTLRAEICSDPLSAAPPPCASFPTPPGRRDASTRSAGPPLPLRGSRRGTSTRS